VSELTIVRGVGSVKARRFGLRIFEAFMIIVALLFISPVVYVLINAFKSTQEIVLNPAGLPRAPTLGNFAKVLSTHASGGGIGFFKSLLNTLILALSSPSRASR
jgi:ABC-type glycerol-3-phosphate transport system permease component